MSILENPIAVQTLVEDASKALSLAHQHAGEREGDQDNLNGPVRDLLFGLNTAVDSLAQMIQEGRFG